MNKVFFEIEKWLSSQKLADGVNLPDVKELAAKFQVNEHEIESALSELVYEGYVERDHCQKERVYRTPVYPFWGTLTGTHSITKEAKKRKQNPGVEILNWELVDAWPSIQERLKLDEGDKVQIMERMRTADGFPVAIETSYFPAKLYPGITKDMFTETGSGQSSFKVMEEKFGLVSERATDEVTLACLEEREAKFLQVPVGTPVLLRFRITWDPDDVPIKASRAVWKFHAGYEMSLHE
ncbi:MAG: GntR family transcriptional regulator [Chloroflexi bacterium]|nr:GntR family transcriptional regulator [Chloroflexota bacterium]